MHIIVFEEYNLPQKLWPLAYFKNLLNESLPCTVCRMGFTGEEEQYRMLRIVYYLGQALEISEQKMGTLIRGKATAEAYHQCIGVNAFHNRYDFRRITLVLQPAFGELLTYVFDKFFF